MKQSRSLKQRLISSVLVLVMLFSSLLGTTFAWFTDSLTSEGNTIQSGNLKIDLLHKTGDDWISIKDNPDHKVFDYDKWEPGYTRVETLKIANLGSLALKYRLSVEMADGTAVTGKNGESIADVIDVYVTYGDSAETSYSDITSSSNWVRKGTLAEVLKNPASFVAGNLLPTGKVLDGTEGSTTAVGSQIVKIALHMQESAGNEYQKLSVGDIYVNLVATQWSYENDSFGNDYDADAVFPELNIGGIIVDVTTENNVVTQEASVSGEGFMATIPAGVAVDAGVSKLGLSVTEKAQSDANLTLNDGEALRSLDVHMSGVAASNTVPMLITIEKAMKIGLNIGNYTLYHVEGGVSNAMTAVNSLFELDAHNEFYYDPSTGNVTLAMATFSEVAMVAETATAWKGNFDYSWYDASKTELTIANADQLAAFGAIVGGMAEGIERDSFKDKTVKLIADINLGDGDDDKTNNGIDKIFHPVGYYYTDDKNADGTKGDYYSTVYSFEGTFDGNGNTIANFYQNTWEIKGDYDGNYYKDAMGLFGYVYGGAVKNLTVDSFSSDGEFTPTGVIAAYAAGNAIFENIAITNCNPRVYNTGNGGIIGIAGDTSAANDDHVTLKNITVDNSNKISALWGSWDVACGGLVGMYRGNVDGSGNATGDTISFENCHVAAQIDVNNDVCANYQYYAYRYSGMIIGSVRHNTTSEEGRSIPNMTGISARGCTVHFGTWNDYYYCELVENTTASYTHDYQMSRLVEIKAIDGTTITYLDGTTGTVPASGRANYVIVDYSKGHGTENATCYHFKNGEVWTHDMGGIQNGIDENGDGQDDLKEDKQHLYLEFNNLFTGYGWGVSSMAINKWNGITALDVEEGDHEESVNKFNPVDNLDTNIATESTLTIGDLFTQVDDLKVAIQSDNVQVTVSPFGANSTAGGTYVANTTDWTKGTLTFSGMGQAVITITDYYFCKTTTVTVNVVGAEKFDTNFVNYKDYLYRVGNADKSTVALGTIFKHSGKGTIHSANVDVTFTTVAGNASGRFTASTSDWTKGTIQFTGTGVVKVTIKDDTSKEFVLNLEVVEAKNYSGVTGESLNATSNNVVLLCNIGSGFTVSGRYTVYGNGFTLNYTGNGQYLNNGLKQGIVTVSENGTIDNLRIKASIYPTAFMYYASSQLGDYVQHSSNPRDVEGDKTRYYYQLSAVAASGNATIQNCYIYGGRTNVFVNTGNVTIKDTILECGVVANVQIQSNASHTITLEDVTTIQYQVKATVGDTSKIMLGTGILVGPDTTENPTIVLNGEFKQYNWVIKADQSAVTDEAAKTIISTALENTYYNHTINGTTASNLGIIFLNSYTVNIKNNTGLPYERTPVSISGASGQVYSLRNATAEQIYSDYLNANRATDNGWYQPQFKYPADLGGQLIPNTDGCDEYVYREGDTIYVMFPSGDSKEIDLAALVNISKYAGQNLGLVITVKDSIGNAVEVTNGKITLSAADTYTVTYTVIDTLFYDKDGAVIAGNDKHSWDVSIEVSLKDTALSDAYFEFDTSKQKMGYYKPTIGDVKQYLPFLAGLKIYDYNGQNAYLRFNGDSDFSKIASITITEYKSNEAYLEIKLTDGGVIHTKFLARADSGGGSTYTGKIKTSNNTIYFVTDSGTSNKDATTTAAYWYVDYYKFTGNNGVEITSAQQTFNSTGSSASTPSGSFSTTIKSTVTFDANGGNCGQTTGYATSASTAVTLLTPTRSGYIFAGWYTAASGGTRVGGAGESYTPSANITLYAQWGKPCTVTYDANGGSCGTASEKYTGTALTLPTPTRDGYWFIGWYDAAEGGNKIGDAGAKYNPANEITLYAHWQEKIEYTVTYNANGGSCGTASATYQGTALTLPTPTRTGYKFLGWYTAASDGTKIGEAGATYVPSANITLYAQWSINSYEITVSTSNGSVSGVTNGQSVPYGTTVSVTVSFDKSNSKTFTVINDTTRETILSKSSAGTYTFTMPDSSVTINVSSGCFTPDTLITLADGTQKRVDELQLTDKILAWDFFTGTYVDQDISFVVNHGDALYRIANLEFSDGSELRVIGEHGVFDYDLNKFVYLSVDNMSEYIGHRFVKCADNGSYDIVTLINACETEEYTSAWSITSTYASNVFASGLLTVGPPDDFYNWIEMDGKLRYDVEQFQKDVETYGLYTYEDFADYLTYDQFVTWNGAYLKIAVEKGYFTFDYILELIEIYGDWMV